MPGAGRLIHRQAGRCGFHQRRGMVLGVRPAARKRLRNCHRRLGDQQCRENPHRRIVADAVLGQPPHGWQQARIAAQPRREVVVHFPVGDRCGNRQQRSRAGGGGRAGRRCACRWRRRAGGGGRTGCRWACGWRTGCRWACGWRRRRRRRGSRRTLLLVRKPLGLGFLFRVDPLPLVRRPLGFRGGFRTGFLRGLLLLEVFVLRLAAPGLGALAPAAIVGELLLCLGLFAARGNHRRQHDDQHQPPIHPCSDHWLRTSLGGRSRGVAGFVPSSVKPPTGGKPLLSCPSLLLST